MDAAIKKIWVEALRSNKYVQTQNCLKRGDSYCVLGVLCELVDPEYWDDPMNFRNRPSDLLLEKVGLSAQTADKLMNLNDIRFLSFDKLANFIERKVKPYPEVSR